MENYIKYKLVGGIVKIKTDVLPHLFNCQEDRERASTSVIRPFTAKRLRREVIHQAGEEYARLSDIKVQSIIDCFEIEIQKPTDPMKQALTWSEYKKCNTLKYLVSATPNGFVNFISSGYGGCISDVLLFKCCGYLDVLPRGCAVMADRGFKHIKREIEERGCVLIRPPSVLASTKPTKSDVVETKRIASLRIHIERVIRRFREYAYLKPHSVIDHNLVSSTDDVVLSCSFDQFAITVDKIYNM